MGYLFTYHGEGEVLGRIPLVIELATIAIAKTKLMLTLLVIMGSILVLSIVLTTAIVSHFPAPIKILSDRADNPAHGKNL